MDNIYLSGIKDKYPAPLLEGRIGAEGNVIGSIWAEPALLSDLICLLQILSQKMLVFSLV